MEVLRRWLSCCFISLSIFTVLSSCQVNDGISQTMRFEPDTHQVTGELRCPDSRLLDIVSIQYNYHSTDCSLTCPSLPDSDGLDGLNKICLNENNIRQSCYAKNNCTLGDSGTLIMRPDDLCGGRNTATALVVVYRCINPEYVFDLCDQRALSVGTDTRLIFTTPSPTSAAERESCECELSSQRIFSRNLTFTLLRMAQFKDGALLFYQTRSTIRASTPYSVNRLLPESVTDIGAYPTSRAYIGLQFSPGSTTKSTAFVAVNSGKNLTVRCNEAPLPTANPETTTRRATTSGSKTAGVITLEDSEIVSSNLANSTCTATYPSSRLFDEESGIDDILIGLSVALAVVLIIFIAVVLVFCLLYRRMQKLVKRLQGPSGDNNLELSSVNPPHISITDQSYQTLNRRDDNYEDMDGDVRAHDDPHLYTRLMLTAEDVNADGNAVTQPLCERPVAGLDPAEHNHVLEQAYMNL